MTISEINIVPVKPQDGLIAFASCVLDGSYYLGGIAIFTRLSGGLRLVYPTRKVGERHMHVHHPISQGMGRAMDDAILRRAEEVLRLPRSAASDTDGELRPGL